MKKYIDSLVHIITGTFLCLIILDIFIQVVYRYILNDPLTWPEEAARIMLVWFAFLGIYLALKENRHIGVELLVKKLPENIRFYVKVLSNVLVMLFLVVVIQQGYYFSMRYIDQQMVYTQIPYGYVYAAFPVSGLLMLIQTIIKVSNEFKNYREEKEGHSWK